MSGIIEGVLYAIDFMGDVSVWAMQGAVVSGFLMLAANPDGECTPLVVGTPAL